MRKIYEPLLVAVFFAVVVLLAIKVNAAYLASDLVGQIDAEGNPVFTTRTIGNSTTTFRSPRISLFDHQNHRLFVAEQTNHRILVFNLDNENNLIDRTADNVLGQINFSDHALTTTRNGLSSPHDIAFDSDTSRLFVADLGNNRVLVYDTAEIVDGEDATTVLGQLDFNSKVATASPSGFNMPSDVTYITSTNHLYVSDWNNNRVLVFDASSITNGEDAINVLGQTNFTDRVATTTQSGLSGPYHISFDQVSSILYVTDYTNNRVLAFDVSTISNGENAINVLGQPNFTSNGATTTRSGLNGPIGASFDTLNRLLIIGDFSNSRVLFYDVSSISDGEDATVVLGQDDFLSGGFDTTQSRLRNPSGVSFDSANRRLYVSDINNRRVLIYNFVRLSSSSFASVVTNITYTQNATSTGYQGALAYSVYSGSLPPGLSLNSTTGEISGAPTTAGTFSFSIRAVDTLSIGSFSDTREYTIVVDQATAAVIIYGTAIPINVSQPTQSELIPPLENILIIPFDHIPSDDISAPSFIEQLVVRIPVNTKESLSIPQEFIFKTNLWLGLRKTDVVYLQKYLKSFFPDSLVTGYYGKITFNTVKRLQINSGIPATGFFGPLTRAFVNNVLK